MLHVAQQLLPRFFLIHQRIEDERKLAKIILEAPETTEANGKPLRRSADGHDWQRRRGLPLMSRGVRSVQPETDPVAELLAKEARGERGR